MGVGNTDFSSAIQCVLRRDASALFKWDVFRACKLIPKAHVFGNIEVLLGREVLAALASPPENEVDQLDYSSDYQARIKDSFLFAGCHFYFNLLIV